MRQNVLNFLIKHMAFINSWESVRLGLWRQSDFCTILIIRNVTFNGNLWREFPLSILLKSKIPLYITDTLYSWKFISSFDLLIHMLELNLKLAILDSNPLDLFCDCVISLFHDFVLGFRLGYFLQSLSVLFLDFSQLKVEP